MQQFRSAIPLWENIWYTACDWPIQIWHDYKLSRCSIIYEDGRWISEYYRSSDIMHKRTYILCIYKLQWVLDWHIIWVFNNVLSTTFFQLTQIFLLYILQQQLIKCLMDSKSAWSLQLLSNCLIDFKSPWSLQLLSNCLKSVSLYEVYALGPYKWSTFCFSFIVWWRTNLPDIRLHDSLTKTCILTV